MTDMLIETNNITSYCTENINILKENIESSNSLATILTQAFKWPSEVEHSSKITLYWAFKSLAKENAKKVQEIQRVVNSVLLIRQLEGEEKKIIDTLNKLADLSFDFFKKASDANYHEHYEGGIPFFNVLSGMTTFLGLGIGIGPTLESQFDKNIPYWGIGIAVTSTIFMLGKALIDTHSRNSLHESAKNLSELVAFPVIVPKLL